MAPECSVVIELCNQATALPALHVRLTATLSRLAIPYEIIYVDDGSRDSTAEVVRQLHEENAAVKVILLSRSFGSEAARCAGLESAAGRAVITLAGDGSDPPEVIPDLLAKWHEGYQVVVARTRRRPAGRVGRAAQFILERLAGGSHGANVPADAGDFALMDRQVVEQLNRLPERNRHLNGLRRWVGFKQTELPCESQSRDRGRVGRRSGTGPPSGLGEWFASSGAPLELVTVLGAALILASLAGVALVLGGVVAVGAAHLGSVLLGLGAALLSGVHLMGLGMVGHYVVRIHHEVRARPLYVARERLGFDSRPRLVPSVVEFLPSEVADRHERITASRLAPEPADS